MGTTITLPAIMAALQNNCGCTTEEAAEFIHALTDTISDSLLSDGSVTVKGVGEFRIIEDGDERAIAFRPDQSLAQEVNSPFALFEPVDLSEGVTEEVLERDGDVADDPVAVMSSDEVLDEQKDMSAAPGSEIVVNRIEEDATVPAATLPAGIPPVPVITDNFEKESRKDTGEATSGATDAAVRDLMDSSVNMPGAHSGNRSQQPSREEDADVDNSIPVRRTRRSRKETAVIVLIGLLSLLAGILVGHFGIPGLNINGVKSVKITAEEVTLLHEQPMGAATVPDTTEVEIGGTAEASADTVEDDVKAQVAETQAAVRKEEPQVVTDTVQGSNYLSRIARRHYGKDIFWVYIYMENKDKIHDPNNIRPGTVVVVPPAEKYGIDPDSKTSVQDAERLSGKILDKES